MICIKNVVWKVINHLKLITWLNKYLD